MDTENNLFDEIYSSICQLSERGTPRNRIKVMTSFITQSLLVKHIRESDEWFTRAVHTEHTKIFGVDISFDHYKNDIVIYDTGRACFDGKFKIVIPIKVYLKPKEES